MGNDIKQMLPMSFLYVPADKPELFAKAARGPADALILDLEDAVPPARKADARILLGSWLRTVSETSLSASDRTGSPQMWVRVNAETIQADLDSVFGPALAGIFLAKCTAETLAEATDYLSLLESRSGAGSKTVGVIGLVERAAALVSVETWSRNDRLLTLAIGEVDLMADLRMVRGDHSESALDSIRARIVVACAASGILPPVAPTSTAIRELDAFEDSSRKMHDLGFRSRTAIHPSQVTVIQRVFSPSAEEAAAAMEIIERFEAAEGGVAVDVFGRLIDAAVVRGAEETLQRSKATAK